MSTGKIVQVIGPVVDVELNQVSCQPFTMRWRDPS